MRKLILLLFFVSCYPLEAQIIHDPIADIMKLGQYTRGRSYNKLEIDIRHHGNKDILLGLQETVAEIEVEKEVAGNFSPDFNPDFHGFAVYLRRKRGGYFRVKYDIEPEGKTIGGVGIDISQCYVGYVKQVKQYGIVTVDVGVYDYDPQLARHGVIEKQVYCYTVDGNYIKKTNLGPRTFPEEKNVLYDEYLSEFKRTKIQLQEVTPGK